MDVKYPLTLGLVVVVLVLLALVVMLTYDGSGSSYGVINVDTGTDPVAVISGDTLNMVSGDGVTVTGDAGTDTLTFALLGCSDQEILKISIGVWGCAQDDTTAVSGAGAVALDLGDNGSNESAALTELATTGDTNSIVTEPSADKVLFNMGLNWPQADTAVALAANPNDCAANQFAGGIAANGDLACSQPAFSDLSGAAT